MHASEAHRVTLDLAPDSVAAGDVVLTGNVLLTQGANALAGEKLTVDLATGVGRMEGRVRTVFGGGNN